MTSSARVRLEPVFLMSVVMRLDALATARRLCCVSRACADAVARMKQNPNYEAAALGTALANSRLANVLREVVLFSGIETLAVDPLSLQKLDADHLEAPLLFHLEGFVQQAHGSPQLDAVADRIVAVALDTSYGYIPPFTAATQLRELTLRVTVGFRLQSLREAASVVRRARFLRKLVIRCDSASLSAVRPFLAEFSVTHHVVVILDFAEPAHTSEILAFAHASPTLLGVTMIDCRALLELYQSPAIVFLPFSHQNVQLPLDVVVSPLFHPLLKSYFPACLELLGNETAPLPISPSQTLIDLTACTSLQELFLNEAIFSLKVVVVLPQSLRHLVINSTVSLDRLVGLSDTHVDSRTQELLAPFV